MNIDLDDAILRLNQNKNLQLRDARGGCVHVHWGDLWITQEGDIKDHVVKTGESFAISKSGMTYLTPMSEAGISVMEKCRDSRVVPAAKFGSGELPVTPATAGTTVSPDAIARDSNIAADDSNGNDYRLKQLVPDLAELDRHIERAKSLRARYFADALYRGWALLRRSVGMLREIG